MMKIKYSTIFMAFVLIASLLCVFGIKVCAAFDMSKEQRGATDEFSFLASDLLHIYLDEEIGEKEKEILDLFGTIVSYKGVEEADIKASVDDLVKLTVTALPYETENLSYVPEYAYTGDKRSVSIGNDKFVIDGVEDESSVTVHYKATAKISKSVMNEIINAAYDKAFGLKSKFEALMDAYEADLAEYYIDQEKYENYLQAKELYENKRIEYQEALKKYNSDLKLWQEQDADYKDYLEEYERYEQEQSEYEEYLIEHKAYEEQLAKYTKYLSEVEKYQTALKAYNDAMSSSDMKKVQYQLSILDYITRPVSELGRTLEGAINGNAVDMVLQNKEALVLKIGKFAYDKAETATYELRRLFNQLLSLTSDEEKYFFYISSYVKLKENFNDLLRVLDYLYTFRELRAELKSRNKERQYEILLAQLYYICMALDDDMIFNYIFEYEEKGYLKGKAFSDSYLLGEIKKASDILDENDRLEDKIMGTPLSGGLPAIPDEPVMPEPVDPPGDEPALKTQPFAPTPVSAPGEKPTEPEMTMEEPVEVTAPTLPVKPVQDEKEAELIKALNDGEFKQRALLTQDFEFPIEREKVIYFRNTFVDLIFHDAEGGKIATVSAERGKAVKGAPQAPQKIKKGFTYTFEGWVTEQGDFINLNRLVTDEEETLSLYPRYIEERNSYTVTFCVDGSEIEKSFLYGDVPVYDEVKDGELKKTGDRLYRFIGWSSLSGDIIEKFPPVEDDVTYIAQFEQSLIVTFDVEGARSQMFMWSGETAHYDGVTPTKESDELYVYTFLGWDKPFEAIYNDTEYFAVFEGKSLISVDDEQIKVRLTEDSYEVDINYNFGKKINIHTLIEQAVEKNVAIKLSLVSKAKSDDVSSELVLSLSTVKSFYEAGVELMTFNQTNKDQRLFIWLELSDGDGAIETNASVKVSLKAELDQSRTYMYEHNDRGDRTEMRVLYGADGEINFTLNAGYKYEITTEYSVSVLKSEYIDISADHLRAGVGDLVTLQLSEPPIGMFLSELYFESGGAKVKIENNSFNMPASDVTIGVMCDFYQYTVVFKSEGKVLLTLVRHYGDIVVPPSMPTKPSDDKYSYTFKGWDKEIVPVTEDAEYNALYFQEELPPIIRIDSPLNKFIKAMYVAVPCFVALMIASAVALIVLKKKGVIGRKKKLVSVESGEAFPPSTEIKRADNERKSAKRKESEPLKKASAEDQKTTNEPEADPSKPSKNESDPVKAVEISKSSSKAKITINTNKSKKRKPK